MATTDVPIDHRPWTNPWPDYRPVDATPPELRAEALTGAVEDWIIDRTATPQEVTDWGQRLAAAVVPYLLTPDGWPLNPAGRTGRCGRDLGRWGENPAVDPIVVAGAGLDRRILLIRRADTGQWAFPGGMQDPGETVQEAMARELLEETGLDLSDHRPTVLRQGYIDDPRNTDHAWVSGTCSLYRLTVVLPVQAGDDAVDALWWPWHGTVEDLIRTLEPAGGLYPAHRSLLDALAVRL